MDKSKPRLYALWECVEHIEIPYVDGAYSYLRNIINQNNVDKHSNYLYSDVMQKDVKGFKYLFINKFKALTKKMYLQEIDSITTKYNNVDGIKNLFSVSGYEKKNQIVIGRKYDKTLKTYPILLSNDLTYINPSYLQEELLSRVNNYDEESFEFFELLSNNESFYKDPTISLILDNITSESFKVYYDGDSGIGLYNSVLDFYDLWIYKDNRNKEINYNNLRKLGLFIKETEERFPKVKQLSLFN